MIYYPKKDYIGVSRYLRQDGCTRNHPLSNQRRLGALPSFRMLGSKPWALHMWAPNLESLYTHYIPSRKKCPYFEARINQKEEAKGPNEGRLEGLPENSKINSEPALDQPKRSPKASERSRTGPLSSRIPELPQVLP